MASLSYKMSDRDPSLCAFWCHICKKEAAFTTDMAALPFYVMRHYEKCHAEDSIPTKFRTMVGEVVTDSEAG